MKQSFTLFFAFVFLLNANLFGQLTNQQFDAFIDFDNAQRPCIQVNLDPEPTSLKKAWKEYLNNNYHIKLKGIGFLTNKDLLSAKGIIVNQISTKEMDFYTQIIENESGSELKLFVRLGYDVYVNRTNYTAEYNALHEILENFIKSYIPKYLDQQIRDTEKAVKNLTHERDKISDDIASKSLKIEKLRTEIKSEEEELYANKMKLESTETKLLRRKEKLDRTRLQLRDL